MDDATKAALEWLRDVVKSCPHPDDGQHEKALLAHLDGEAARTQVACDRRAEEVREACARHLREHARHLDADGAYLEKVVATREAADRCAGTPLTATPLKDENEALRASLERANEGVRYWTDLAQLRAEVDAARAYAHKTLANDEECDPFRLLRVMDEARTKRAVNSLTVERGPKGGAA